MKSNYANLNHIFAHEAWKINKQLYPAHPQLDFKSYPNGSFHREKPSRDRLMPLSPNKANYFRLKHPSNMKTQVSGYKIPFVNNAAQLTSNVLVCIYFLFVIAIWIKYHTIAVKTKAFLDMRTICMFLWSPKILSRQAAHWMLIRSQWFYGFHLSSVKQTGWKWIKDAEFFGNWVILQNRCHFCLSNTYVEKWL